MIKNGVNSNTESIAEQYKNFIEHKDKMDRILKIAPILVLGAVFILFSFIAPNFLTMKNFLVLLNQLSLPLLVATGVTFVIMIGSIDLSVDGVMGLTGSVIGLLVLNNKTMLDLGFIGVLITVIIGGICGALTGVIVVKGKIPSFMVSFGMLSITSGVAILSYSAVPPMIQDVFVRSFALKRIMGLPLYFYVSLIIFIAAYIIQEKTAFGKYLYAIGENESLARVSGIKVDSVKIKVFIWTGLVVGVAGVMGAAQLGRGDVMVGYGNLFPALAAVVLGGTTLSGGRGGVVNTLIGTAVMTILANGLILMGVNPYFKSAIVGVILILAIALTSKRNKKLITK